MGNTRKAPLLTDGAIAAADLSDAVVITPVWIIWKFVFRSSLSSEVEDLDIDVADSRASMEIHSEEIVMQTAVSSEEVCATAIDKEPVLITQAGSGSLCEKENWSNSIVEMDDEGGICMRTRARYSLASFTLDELETFLQESDEEDDLQNVDDEEEYRKFLAAVRGDDSQTLIWNANANDEDEENDADFELELEEALESEPEEVEERRMTRRNRCQKASLERRKKLSGKLDRPLRPLLPFGSFPAFDGKQVMPNTTPSYTARVNNGVPFGFTPHQIGQLHCLIHEHVQLLIQVFSLCVLEPVKRNIAAEVKELAVEMVRKRDQALTCRTVPYPSFCFSPPYVHPSVSDGVQIMLPPKDSNENVQRDISTECTSWVPYVCGPVLSVVDVAPLRLVEDYMDDVSSALRAYERDQIERGFEFGCQKEPLFPLHSFPCSAESDDLGEMENNTPDASGMLYASPKNQIPKKTMAATLLEKTKNQTVAVVPKEVAKLAQRFCPLFNPALYPHKPPHAALVNRVLFTDAEDELLAMGLMEYNTDWKAIQQRFLPCKSWHQIFVRQKNRASSKAPENPIKAVRRMKNSPLTSEEIACVEMGLKRLKLDWISIWRSFVPYRDPSLLPRQWRIACGTQKSYKSHANRKINKRLYDLKRRTSKSSPSTWHSSFEKEGDSYDNAVDGTNSGDNRIDKEDEAYVHEAFLADWRQDDNNVSSHNGSIQPQTHSKSLAAISSQVVLRPYRARRQNSARTVKLAPGLPPVNLPPSVRIMSQSDFKSSEAVASSKISGNASRIAELAGSSVKSGPSRNNIIASSQQPNHYQVTIDKGDLQMHPLLFQAPQDGHFPYYPVHSSTSTSSSFTFFKGKQPQLNLSLFHNPRHIRNTMDFLSKSSKPPEKNVSSSSDVEFHPLLQRNDEVGTHSIASDYSTIIESRQRHASMQNPSASKSRNVNELDLDIHLSFTSKNQEASGRRDVTTCDTGRLRRASRSGAVGSESASKDSGNKRDCARDGISDELNSGDMVIYRNKGNREVSDSMGDESLPGIIMEQEELSDSEEELGENVEFECEEMADSEGDSMSDSEQIANLPNEEVRLVEMNADNDDAPVLNTRSDSMYGGNNKCSTSGGHSSELESTGKGVIIEPNVSSLNLNFIPPVSPLSNPKNVVTGYEFGSWGTTGTFDHNQLHPSPKGSSRHMKPGWSDTLPRNPRKRVCRSSSNSSVARSRKVSSSTNVDFSVEKLEEC